MNDTDILARLNLSDADLTDYLVRYHAFFGSLNDAQKQFALRAGTTSDPAVAAAAFHPEVTPAELQSFFAARAGALSGTALGVMFIKV